MKRLILVLLSAALVAVAAIPATAADYPIARRAVISCADHPDAPYLYYSATDLLWHCGTAAPTGTSLVTTPLPVANGGTAIASYAIGDLIYASGATTLSKLADVAVGRVLVSGGIGVAPAFSTGPVVATAGVTTSLSVGGTGAPGAAAVQTDMVKAVTGFTDTTATDVLTVTVPNAQHAAVINLDVMGILGAGGAIGAGEATRLSKYQIVLARTAGVATVATVSSAIGGAESHVAGATSIATVVVTVSTMTGAASATQTFTVKVAITKTGGAADNHKAVIRASVLNQNASGVTIS